LKSKKIGIASFGSRFGCLAYAYVKATLVGVEVQFSNFAAPVVAAPTTSLFKDVTVGTLDAVAKTVGLPFRCEALADVRIKSSSWSF
jgi:hypothetical protein